MSDEIDTAAAKEYSEASEDPVDVDRVRERKRVKEIDSGGSRAVHTGKGISEFKGYGERVKEKLFPEKKQPSEYDRLNRKYKLDEREKDLKLKEKEAELNKREAKLRQSPGGGGRRGGAVSGITAGLSLDASMPGGGGPGLGFGSGGFLDTSPVGGGPGVGVGFDFKDTGGILPGIGGSRKKGEKKKVKKKGGGGVHIHIHK